LVPGGSTFTPSASPRSRAMRTAPARLGGNGSMPGSHIPDGSNGFSALLSIAL
jgi:hypothetical protein